MIQTEKSELEEDKSQSLESEHFVAMKNELNQCLAADLLDDSFVHMIQ